MQLEGLDWVIAGGESGHGARPCNVEWIRSIVKQCEEAKVPVFVKQLGSKPVFSQTEGYSEIIRGRLLNHKKGADMSEWPEDLRVREFPDAEKQDGRVCP